MTPTDPPLQPGEIVHLEVVVREIANTLRLVPLGPSGGLREYSYQADRVRWRRAAVLDEADDLARRCEELTAQIGEARAELATYKDRLAAVAAEDLAELARLRTALAEANGRLAIERTSIIDADLRSRALGRIATTLDRLGMATGEGVDDDAIEALERLERERDEALAEVARLVVLWERVAGALGFGGGEEASDEDVISAAKALLAERDAMRPVVEAAEAWRERTRQYPFGGEGASAQGSLRAAVDTYRARQKAPETALSPTLADEQPEVVREDDNGAEGTTAGRKWVLTLICCGREDGRAVYDSWEAANADREAYTSGPSVEPHGYSAEHPTGHVRAAILTAEDPSPTTVTPDNSAGRRDWGAEVTTAMQAALSARQKGSGPSFTSHEEIGRHLADALGLDAMATELTALRDLRHTLITALGGQERDDEELAVAVRSLVEDGAGVARERDVAMIKVAKQVVSIQEARDERDKARRKYRRARKALRLIAEQLGLDDQPNKGIATAILDAISLRQQRAPLTYADAVRWKVTVDKLRAGIGSWADYAENQHRMRGPSAGAIHAGYARRLRALLDDAAPPQHPDGTQTAAEVGKP